MKYIIYCIAFILLLANCKPAKVFPLSNDPVFTTTLNVGGANNTFTAGDNHVFMYTNYAKDSFNNSLFTLKGRFGIDTCFTCGPYLEILLNANKNTAGVIDYSMDSIVPGAVIKSYSLAGTSTSQLPDTIYFNVDNVISTVNNWNYGDGTSGQGSTSNHVYTGGQSYTFTYQFSTDSTDKLVNKLSLSPFFYEPLNVDSIIYPKGVKVFPNACTTCVSTINWGDNSTNTIVTGAATVPQHNYINDGKYKITKTTIQGTDTAIAQAIVQLDTLGNVPYSFSPSLILDFKNGASVPSNYINYNTAIINYKLNNILYSSFKNNNTDQSKKPILTINNVGDYELNELNQKTKLIEASVNTYLYNTQNVNDSILINTSTLRFGVAVPK